MPVTKEALSRLPELDLRELQELWCRLYKTATAPRLGRELLMRAVAYRVQELGNRRAASGAAAPTPPDRLGAAANRAGHDAAPPAAEARDSVAAGMAGPQP